VGVFWFDLPGFYGYNYYQGTDSVYLYLGGLADEDVLEGCPEIQNCCECNPYVLGIHRVFVV
jgi:hypothetical protein